MSGVLFSLPNARQLSNSGAILPGWKLKFFLTGTTTPTPVYSDGDLETSLGTTVTADLAGMMVPIYLDPAVVYRVQLFTAADVLIQDVDPMSVAAPGGGGARALGYFSSTLDTVQAEGVAEINWNCGTPGVYEVVFDEGLFSSAPSVTATPLYSSDSFAVCELEDVTAAHVIIHVKGVSNSGIDRGVHFHAFEIVG